MQVEISFTTLHFVCWKMVLNVTFRKNNTASTVQNCMAHVAKNISTLHFNILKKALSVNNIFAD